MISAIFALAFAVAASAGGTETPTAEVFREGTLEAVVADDFERGTSRTTYRLIEDDGRSIEIEFSSPPSFSIRSGRRLRVAGVPRGDVFLVNHADRLSGVQIESAESSWTLGAKKVLVILLNFTDDTTQPYTVTQARNTVFGASGSVAAFYAEGSYGATTLSGDIAGWYTAPIAKPTTCDISAVQTQAQNAATAAGYNRASYDLEVYVFPKISACGWSGLAYVGWSGAWINQALSTYVAAHELGHNYGLLHAHSWSCGTTVLGSSCTRGEYGDRFDTMGGGAYQFSGYSKKILAWLPGAGYTSLSGGSATVTLSSLESGSGVRGLQLLTDAGRTYWVEFRQPIGFDAPLGGNANVMNGVLVRLAPSAVGGTDLLDMTPDGVFSDAALTVGNVYTDSGASLRFTPTSTAGGTITVDVEYGVTAPTAGFTFLPSAPTGGQSVAFTNTSTGLPTSFAWDFDDGSVSTLKNPTHAFASAGTYQVTLIASNGAGASTAFTQSVTVSSATALGYYPLTPCRLVDTRSSPGPYGAPSLSNGISRSFIVTGHCGIPSSAAVVALNVTAVRPSQNGFVTFSTATSVVNFRAGQTRANSTMATLGTGGTVVVTPYLTAAGTVDLVLDTVGYFQ